VTQINAFKSKVVAYFDDGVSPPVSPPPPPPSPPVTPPAKTFTQDEVNKMMAENRRNLQKAHEDTVKQLEEIRNNAKLTVQEKEDLDVRIQTLQQQHLTEQQKLALELDTTKKKYKTDTEALSGEAKKWQSQFQSTLATTAILEGSAKHQAASAKQMIALLGSKVKVVEEVDEAGKPTGRYVPKLPMTVIDPKTKKPVDVELDVIEAIGQLRTDPEYANLFLVDGKPGLGGNNANLGGGNGSTPDFSKMSPADYKVWRKANMK
jgi:hypothetical protein